MYIKDERIDRGRAFDWGRTSDYYAKFRDIYPEIFYRKITGLGPAAQHVQVWREVDRNGYFSTAD